MFKDRRFFYILIGALVVGFVGGFVVSKLTATKKEKFDKIASGKVIAKVGDIKIYERDLNIFPPFYNQSQVLDELIKITLFYLGAIDEGYDKKLDIRLKLRWNKMMTLAQEYLNNKLVNVFIPEEKVESFYQKHKKDFNIDVSYIMVSYMDKNLTPKIKKYLSYEGKKLEGALNKLTQEYPQMVSVMPMQGVNLGQLYMMPEPKIAEEISRLSLGDVSNPIEVQGGYILVKLLERTRSQMNKSDIKMMIRQFLTNMERQKKQDSLYRILSKKYKVKKFLGSVELKKK